MLHRTTDPHVAAMLDVMASRRTATQLAGPAPTSEQIRLLIAAADNAPDHGKLRPWHVMVVEGAARERLGDMFAQGPSGHQPALTDMAREREKAKALRAPAVLIVSAKVSLTSKIPAIEQIIAVAAAVQNMLLAAQAMGLGAAWKTGWPAYDEAIKAQLGLQPTDQIVAFIYLGNTVRSGAPVDRAIDDIVSWL